ncbi:MAG: tetratricopeptide repeat protein [Planctomycetota bacterium]
MSRGSRKERRERKQQRAEGAAVAGGAASSGPDLAQALASRATALARTRWFLPAVLGVLTLGVWARTFAVPIVEWDDDTYIYRDARLAELSAENVWRVMTEPYFANYHPVTTLTYAFDRAVYGRWAPGFHATQLAFYVAGVILLYYLFRMLLGSAGWAFAAAAMYSVHAIHVEPVAWLAQRKDVVCLAFYAGAVLAYVRYAKEGEEGGRPWRFYGTAVALAALAMLSKGYAVVLPGVLVAYDLCFAGRFAWRKALDKLPFVALALAVTVFTILSQGKDSALTGESLGVGLRATALLHVFAAYVGRVLLPIRLCAKYALNSDNVSLGLAFLGFLLASAFATGFVLLRRRLPAAAFGIALFVLPLATVMNTFWTLFIWQTDRYLFLPTMGAALALAAGGVVLWREKGSGRGARVAVAAGATAATALYAALSVARIGVWTDPVLLWSDTLRKQMGLGGSGPVTAAELHGIVALTGRKLSVVDPLAYEALASAYRRAGNDREADALTGPLTKKPGAGETGVDLSLARREIAAGRHDKAIELLRPMVEGKSWLVPAALKLTGDALAAKGDVEGARDTYRRSLERYRAQGQAGAEAAFALANLDYKARRFKEATENYRRVLKSAPDDANAKFFLGASLCEIGSAEEGYALYEQVLARARSNPRGSPSLVNIHTMMGKAAQEKLGRPAEAVRHFEELLRLAPDHPERGAIRLLIRQQRALMERGR